MIFKKNMIDYLDQNISDWQEGVKLGSQLLINNGYVDETYVNEIIDITKQHGPYYIIAPKIALLHVAPKGNIKENAISFTYFKNPIIFKDHDNYHVNYCLALLAKDNNSHMDVLQKVAKLFSKQDFLLALSKSQSKKDLIKVIKKYDIAN